VLAARSERWLTVRRNSVNYAVLTLDEFLLRAAVSLMTQTSRRVGFSVIEIVVVITILGILAAFAVPRFASVEVEARSAATTALGGSLKTNVALAHALWLGQSQPDAVSMDGATIAIENGYPAAASVDATLTGFDGFAYQATGSVASFVRLDDHSLPIPNCAVTYVAPEAPGAAPSVTVDVTGC